MEQYDLEKVKELLDFYINLFPREYIKGQLAIPPKLFIDPHFCIDNYPQEIITLWQTERNRLIVRIATDIKRDYSLQTIANLFNCSRQNINKILKKEGINKKEIKEKSKQLRRKDKEEAFFIQYIHNNPNKTMKEISTELKRVHDVDINVNSLRNMYYKKKKEDISYESIPTTEQADDRRL